MTYTTADLHLILKLTRKIYAERKADRAENVAMHAAEGHTPHYCIHGTNQWTDYDNICGWCEDGVTMLRMSRWAAEDVVDEFKDRLAHMTNAITLQPPGFDMTAYCEWVWEPVAPYIPTVA